MSALVGAASAMPLAASDQRLNAAWWRDDLFCLDTDNLRAGYAPRSRPLGEATAIVEAVWWEETDLGWGGPNYAPNAYTLTGPTFSRGITSAAALAIYDSP